MKNFANQCIFFPNTKTNNFKNLATGIFYLHQILLFPFYMKSYPFMINFLTEIYVTCLPKVLIQRKFFEKKVNFVY